MVRRSAVARVAFIGVSAAMLIGVQVAMASLPNIELVSLLVFVYARSFGKDTLYSIYVFAVIEGIIYGFHIWWIMYLYVWTVLYIIAVLTKKTENPIVVALLLGGFGMAFGTLCSIPYFFILGVRGGFAYIASGLTFDIPHAIGNFVLGLILYAPLIKAAKYVAGATAKN